MLQNLTPEQRASILMALVLIVAVGIVGLLIVAWLMRTWKRYTDRLKSARDEQQGMPDIWKEGGDRLVATMSPYPRSDDSSAGWDDGFNEDLADTDDYDPGPPDYPADLDDDNSFSDDDDDDKP